MMPGSLVASFILVLADAGIWDWATADNHGTIALGTGLAMVPLFVTLLLYLARSLFFLVLRRWFNGLKFGNSEVAK